MNVEDLGFNDWFSGHAAEILQPGQNVARVVAVDRNAYIVRSEGQETPAELSGRLRFGIESDLDLPCVGDWVCVQYASPELAIIHAVLPRRSFLRRKRPGKTVDFQMIAANIDVAFVVQSCHYDFNIRRLDRYLVACKDGGIEPVVILTKTDLMTPEEVDGQVMDIRGSGIGSQILPVSNTTGKGLDRFCALVESGKTYCLIGSSGVGKSTLINRLMGSNELETKEVSVTGEGTHTTSRRQLLLPDNGAMLIDTPGMREFGLLGASDGLDESFSEIHDLSMACRFADCTHTDEPGCAVLEAVENDELSEERYQSYIKLKKENEYHDMSYVEKRKRDRDFGRFIKTYKRQRKR
ncbi:ribosome small subunit-dependent GTPase A [Prosthecochloris sp. GSB1]|uniref:ribosome small subunit-dependent GTPase A n=1 Tax=Prosthecochloris sp. GSB1 TaxID=281093 RepID=UPI000B8CF983|nr:ribosome small subunit-dependent GTPase A [Prosthecochloris sp. GSB1]ASQ91593.1 ribosome small subunit-dependent GTPase A [Prosthecochloris sp. GSB1]